MIEARFHIRKNDQVYIIAGKEKGKMGKVLKVITKDASVLVEKLNMFKKHMKGSQKNPQGGIVEKEGPIHISNLLMYCSKCSKPVRIGRKFVEEGKKKVRVCKKCGEVFDKI